ncbi:hypothetical protein ESA94_14070 [Lacibacter luteus]|uniref:Glycosyltransferase RgtA/B/C/D-like domain-containing protein n=1 Tax=Lacibacter luteus TaxID=2508719 RepID=A0A4Q1CGS9_9BACT|nr:hypothetical protein [Lacibacter luteus]RXK59263.1 hypothetical protein ESA94_14070 [Lacibacter luteus]
MKQSSLSRNTFFLCGVLMLLTSFFYYPKWNKQGSEATISWDVSGYYMYLPATFIYKDLKKCTFKDSVLAKYQPTPDFQQAFLHSSGNYVMKYPLGQALVMLPFFTAAHLYTKATNGAANGFSKPYQFALSFGMLLIAFLGLWVLRKILLHFYSDTVTALSIFCIALITNYFNYAAIDNNMVHNSLFTIYALLIYNCILFYKTPTIKKALHIGLFIGWATIIRPTEIISILIPLLWGIDNFTALKNRLQFFIKNIRYLLVAATGMAIFLFVQLAYWKYVSNEWVVYSYQDQGFSWLHPHLYRGMFSSNNGWITYTPVMLLAFIGLPFLYKQRRQLFYTVFLFTCLFIYICFAWDIWWYGGSMGMRAMIQAYPLLTIALAAAIERIIAAKNYVKTIAGLFIGFCLYYNVWLTHQAHLGGLYRAGEMTDAYLKAVFLKWQVEPQTQFLLDRADNAGSELIAASELYTNNFDTESDSYATTNYAISGKSILLTGEKQSTPEYFFAVPQNSGDYLRASATFRTERKEWNTWGMAQFIVKLYNDNALLDYKMVRVFRVLNDNETKRLFFDAKLPKGVNKASVSFWNSGSDRPLLIDDLKVLLLEK